MGGTEGNTVKIPKNKTMVLLLHNISENRTMVLFSRGLIYDKYRWLCKCAPDYRTIQTNCGKSVVFFSAAQILLRIYQNPTHLNGARWRTRFGTPTEKKR